MKEQLISKEEIKKAVPALNGKRGDSFIEKAMRLLKLDEMNRLYDQSKQHTGPAFCEGILHDIGVRIVVENKEVINQFNGQPFITVSNHPYGHIDGLSLIAIIAKVRPDYKIMANLILGLIDTMASHFIVVNPYRGEREVDAATVDSVKKCLTHIEDGHPFGFFPAGAVSNFYFKKGKIEDRQWKRSTVRLIQKAKVPVIPLYFSGRNSSFYYFLNMLSWKLSSIRLPKEIINKKDKTVYMHFGDPIMPEEQAQYPKCDDFGTFLRGKIYALAKKSEKSS